LDIKSIAKTLTYKMTSRASAGKKSRAPCEPRLMSHCDFQAQLKSPLKAVGRHHYVHFDGFDLLPADVTARLVAAESLAQITRGNRYNVARFDVSHDRVALLNYPSFFEDAFPALHESWHVDVIPGRVRYRNYRDSLTPPILHRKELMLPEDHPRRSEFQALTKAAEAIGLFEDSTRIGFREQWLRLVREKGYQIVGHDLIPIANDEVTEVTTEAPTNGGAVARHLTALATPVYARKGKNAEIKRHWSWFTERPSQKPAPLAAAFLYAFAGDPKTSSAIGRAAGHEWTPGLGCPTSEKRRADF
jgi:hypothetical protein